MGACVQSCLASRQTFLMWDVGVQGCNVCCHEDGAWTERGLTVVEGLDMVEKVGGVLEVRWECFDERSEVEINEFGDKYGGGTSNQKQ